MAKGEESLFPCGVNFLAVGDTLTFADLAEVEAFLDKERTFWIRFSEAGDVNVRNIAKQNLGFIHAWRQHSNAEELLTALFDAARNFVPATAGRTQIFAEVFQSDPELARMAFAMYRKDDSVSFNTAHPKYAVAQAIVCIVQYVGNFRFDIQQIAADRVALDRHRANVDLLEGRYENLVSDIQTDWKNRIEGFEAKISLRAPRVYWEKRENKQKELANLARNAWQKGLLVLIFIVCLGFLITIYQVDKYFVSYPPGENGWLIGVGQRVVFIGTLIAISVWWLRQKLREMRAHDSLAEDAAERVTMIDTYAALLGAGLEDKDLTNVLAAIYRPAAQPITDDAGPMLPLEILLKGLGDFAGKK